MANKIVLKKSSVAAKVPLTTDLDYGELALNYADEKLYFKNSSNTIKAFNVNATGATLTISTGLSGTSYNGSTAVTIAIDSTVATLTGTQTLTNKTISGASNTLSNIPNSALTNSSVTINGTSVSLGGSGTVTAAAGTLTGTTLNSTVVTSSLTTVGTIATGTWNATNIALGKGGTNAALTAVNGGVVYSNASAMAITAAGTAGQALLSAGAAAPVWTTLSLTDLPDAWVKRSVRVATTANITLSAPQTIDGISVIAGDRVLVKDQTTASQNGIYVVAAGAWTRSTDADTTSELAGALVNVDSGTVNGGIRFDTDLKSTDTLGTTAVNFYKAYDTNDAATTNTASKLVLRDTSGNFSAGTITAALTGNASTATTLQTARTINTVSFNGSANIVVEPFVESDDSTNATRYITFVDSTTDGHQRLNEDSNFTINPSTGTVTTNGAFASIFSLNKNTIDTSYSIPSGYNATSAGPVVINNGITVTIPTGSTWVIV